MGIRFVTTGQTSSGGGTGGTYDHSLLINRGMEDQHTIESVTGLRSALNKKYEKPFSGIPRSDLAFDAITSRDLDVLRNTDLADIINNLTNVTNEVTTARGSEATLIDYINTKVSYGDYTGGGSGSGGHVNSQVGYPLYEEHVTIDGQRTFVLGRTYEVGSKQLEVYLDGLLMVAGRDYVETNDHTVDFLFDLEDESIVLFKVKAVINSGLYEEYIATADQTQFQLVSPYGIHQNILRVYRNGILQQKGKDYTEVDNRTILFKYPLEEDDSMIFIQGGATDPIAGTIMESEIGRLKINHALTTMLLHDAVETSSTDYADMYVDTFITDQNIDREASFDYVYNNRQISVGESTFDATTTQDFLNGSTSNTDVETFSDSVHLLNLSGGAELHLFDPHQVTYTGENQVHDVFTLRNHYKSQFRFASMTSATGITTLYLYLTTYDQLRIATEKVIELASTDGFFFHLHADTYKDGSVHLVYHEQGSSSGISQVFYLALDQEGGVLTPSMVVSDPLHDAITPKIYIDQHRKGYIVFSSKRVNGTFFNVDYRLMDDGLSGFKNVSFQDAFDALNPDIVAGANDRVWITYETAELTTTTKNIKLAVFDSGIKVKEMYVTTSDVFDNIMPDMDIDSLGILRLAWRSKRLSSNWGIDYCAIQNDYTISAVASVVSDTTLICSRPSLSVDYEDISHIVFSANEQSDVRNNICYAYVYPSNNITAYENIASDFEVSFDDAVAYAMGDEIIVSFLGANTSYEVKKKIGNYANTGRYDITFDAISENSEWKAIHVEDYLPTGTLITYEYRVTNDQVSWSSWKPISDISSSFGRYIHIRATLSSDQIDRSPEIFSIAATTDPSYIFIQSIIKNTGTKDPTDAIVIPKFDGDIQFFLSRDGGTTFTEATPNVATNLATKPVGREIVVRAKIKNGSTLQAWAVVW